MTAGKSVPPISGQSGKTSAEAVAVTCDPNSSSANVARGRERGEQREPLARAAAADPAGIAGTDGQEDQQPDERHRRGQVGRDRLAGVAEADGLPAEPRLEPDERDRAERRPQDRSPVAVVEDGEEREAEDLEPDDRRDGPMDPLDPGLRVVERRDELAVAERPVRAAQAGIGGADDDADRDQHESGREGQRGELLEAGHGPSFYRRRPGFGPSSDTLTAR